jgi:hypothetical protein
VAAREGERRGCQIGTRCQCNALYGRCSGYIGPEIKVLISFTTYEKPVLHNTQSELYPSS